VNESESAVGRQVWGPWATAGFGLAVGVVFLVTQVVVLGVFAAVKSASDPHFDPSQLVEDGGVNGLVLVLGSYATTLLCLGLIFIIVRRRKGATIAGYLALRPIPWKTFSGLLALTAGFVILSDGLTYLLGRSIVPQFQVDGYRTCGWPPLLWIAVVLAGPAFEEIFFRGFLFEGFRRSPLGDTGTVALTALAWALVHLQYDVYQMTIILALGVLLGVVRLKTGSVWSCFLVHAFYNLVSTIWTMLCVHGLGSWWQ
jgi:membrane protease YdiL (CAAX protease family)